MRIFRHYSDLPTETRGAAVAVGNFDGLHLGHRAVIGEAGVIARAAGLPWAVLTFEPHPRRIFNPGADPFRLTPLRCKARLVEEMGVDCMIVLRFDREFSKRGAESFVRDVLVDGIGAAHVVSGYDFVFGHRRKGNCELLLRMGKEHGFGFTAQQALEDENGEVYSSTRARDFLRGADPVAASRVLGRTFEIEGRVVPGDGRGQALGYPTANVCLGDYLRPAVGIYAVRAGLEKGPLHDGAASLGYRPTFGGEDLVLEVHLFDFHGDLYGRRLRVNMVEYLRAEEKFDGIGPLKAKMAEDCARARRILRRRFLASA